MDHLKQCGICGQEPAGISCPSCGKVVGPKCFDAKKGACKACVYPNQ